MEKPYQKHGKTRQDDNSLQEKTGHQLRQISRGSAQSLIGKCAENKGVLIYYIVYASDRAATLSFTKKTVRFLVVFNIEGKQEGNNTLQGMVYVTNRMLPLATSYSTSIW